MSAAVVIFQTKSEMVGFPFSHILVDLTRNDPEIYRNLQNFNEIHITFCNDLFQQRICQISQIYVKYAQC